MTHHPKVFVQTISAPNTEKVAFQLLKRLHMPIKKVLNVQYVDPLEAYPNSYVEINFLNEQDRPIHYSIHTDVWQKASKEFAPARI